MLEDLALLTPLIALVGGAVAWWVQRAERREALMIEYWKTRALEAEKERDEWERRGVSWHGQLLEAGIKPDPRWGDPV